ncbi:MAG: YkgJ family cysteine cluster protein, partial [Halobacteriaceae archaeon]
CTRCGKCCKGDEEDPHTATIFPDEIRELQSITDDKWENIARPMPYGLENNNVTFEWALQTQKDDCVFYEEPDKNMGKCTVHGSHPLICQTYPFSIEIFGTVESLGEKVDTAGFVTIHECEGIGRDIDRDHAEELAKTLKERAITEIEEAIAVTE